MMVMALIIIVVVVIIINVGITTTDRSDSSIARHRTVVRTCVVAVVKSIIALRT